MANFKEKIQDLLKSTSSEEVKLLCESFLKDTDGKNVSPSDMVAESLFSNLKNYVNDSMVSALLNEREDHAKSIMDIESKISRDAAKRLMESWDTVRKDKKVSNVGNHKDNTISAINESASVKNNEIISKLSSMDDESAKNFVKKTSVENFSLREALSIVKSGQIINQPNVKYAVARMETALMENAPEYVLVNDFLSSMAPFKWDASVKNATAKVQEAVNAKATELEVLNTIHAIKATDNKRFFTELLEKMNGWLYSDNKNVHELTKSIKGYSFNPYVKSLVDKIMLMENSKGTQFNIPVKGTNCSVNKIYSPIMESSAGQIFMAGKNFYRVTSEGISVLSESQINGLPKNYLELCEAFFNPSVKVVDDVVTAYVGKTKFQITSDKKVFVNEREIDVTTLGSQLILHTQRTIFRDDSNMANVIMNVFENMDSICEIDYGKMIASNVFEGVGVYLFKKNDKIFINKFNEGMNENQFIEANALQTVNLVKSFLSFDMSESLMEFLEGDFKRKAVMESKLGECLKNITLLESELDKVEQLVLADPSYGDIKEVSDAKTLLENEISKLKSAWQLMNEELAEFQTVVEKKAKSEEAEENEEAEAEEEHEETENKEVAVVDVAKEDEPVVVVSTEVKDSGMLGASGEQSAQIQGNDNIDAKAVVSTEDVTSVGFAGAEGSQHNPAATKASTEITKETQAEPVITPGQTAEVITATVPVDVQVSATPETAKASDDSVETLASAVASKEEENAEEAVEESIGIDSKVKDKVSGNCGKVTAINDKEFSVLLDDGETVTRTLSQLEDVKEVVDQTIEDNKNAAVEASEEVAESKKEEEKEIKNEFVSASLTIDLGPFKAGDVVEIDAANYTAVGDDEPVKLKDEKDGVSEIPKKYLKVTDEKSGEIASSNEEALKKLKELEDLLKGDEKGLEKIKELVSLLGKEPEEPKEEKEEEKEKEEDSEKTE